MAEKQLIFKDDFVSKLRADVESGESVDRYYSDDEFYIGEENGAFYCPFLDKPDTLSLISADKPDFENAVILFEAYPKLAPIQASSEVLWVTLAHTDLFKYVQKRWPCKRENLKDHILEKWFIQNDSDIFRNALAGLWWSVYLSCDEKTEGAARYELTEVMFKNETFRARVFGTSMLARHREAARGILRYIKDNEDMFKDNFERKGRFIMKYFNQLGASKQLSAMPETFFMDTLGYQAGSIINAGADKSLDTDGANNTERDIDTETEDIS